MDEPVRLTMPDGTVIWARVQNPPAEPDTTAEPSTPSTGFAPPAQPGAPGASDGGASDVGWPRRSKPDGETPPAVLGNFVETVRSVAATVHDAVAAQAPSGVSVEFGLELSAQTGQFVAVLAQVGAKTSVKVRLDWDRAALTAKPPAAPPPPAPASAPAAPDSPAAAGE